MRQRALSGLSPSGPVTGTCGVPGVGGRCPRGVPAAGGGARGGGAKRLLRPRLCSRRGPAPSPAAAPLRRRTARPGPAPLTAFPALTPPSPRHATASFSYLGFPSLQLLQPLLVLHGVCAGEQVLRAGGGGAGPAPSPRPGRTRRCPLRARPASHRQLPRRGHRRRHLQLHVNTRPGKVTCARPLLLPPPPGPPPRARPLSAPPPARLPPSPGGAGLTPARPPAAESRRSHPRRSGFEPRKAAAGRGQRARTARWAHPPHTPSHPLSPPHTPPCGHGRGVPAAHKGAAPPRGPALTGLWTGGSCCPADAVSLVRRAILTVLVFQVLSCSCARLTQLQGSHSSI